MARDAPGDDDPALEPLLDALHDEDCRNIVAVLSEPMTADEIAKTTEIPLSTTYRKLDKLTEASLVEEGVEIQPGGQHASRYAVAFEAVSLALSEDNEFEIELSRTTRSADERLAELWSEVRKET